MKETVKKFETDTQPQSTENTEQQGATIYYFEEEKRKRERHQTKESDIQRTEESEIIRIQESLKPNKKTEKKNAYYSHHFQNAIDVFKTSDAKGQKKAVKKFEKVFDHAIMGGVLNQETVMLYLIQAGANNMIQESSLSFYKKLAKSWPEINFVLNASQEELQEINNKYVFGRDAKDFSEYYWANIYDEKAERKSNIKRIGLLGRMLGR